jgi:hypothetical protein
VQNRYVGDVGDFGKYALLNALCCGSMRLGVAWCLNSAEESNSDGTFVRYSHIRECNPVMFDQLAAIVSGGTRHVDFVQNAGLFHAPAVFYAEAVPLSLSATSPTRRLPAALDPSIYLMVQTVMSKAYSSLTPPASFSRFRCQRTDAQTSLGAGGYFTSSLYPWAQHHSTTISRDCD